MPLLSSVTAFDRRPAVAPPAPRTRAAVRADLPRILELLRLQHEEAPLAKVNWEKVSFMLEKVLPKPNRDAAGIAFVALEGDLVVGAVCLVFGSLWFTDDLHLDERFFFVHPAHRKSTHAQRLMERAKAAQRTLTIPLVSAVFSTKDTERKVAFFRRHLPMVGAIFRYTGD